MTALMKIAECLSAAEWALVLGVDKRTVNLWFKGVSGVRTGRAVKYPASALPVERQAAVEELLRERRCHSPAALADQTRLNTAWTPRKPFGSYPAATRARANAWKEILAVYHHWLARPGARERDANRRAREKYEELAAALTYQIDENTWAAVFNKKTVTERNVRKWRQKIDERGGIEFAPDAAYCDDKSSPHPNQRLDKLVPAELIAEFRNLCARPGVRYLSVAYRELRNRWLRGEPVPGVEPAPPGAMEHQFPFTYAQIAHFKSDIFVLALGRQGKAHARAKTLPYITRTTGNLRYGQRYTLDDTRVDIMCINDFTGQLVEVNAYFMMELAARRVVSYAITEGRVLQRHVDALVTRALQTNGICSTGAAILHERGATACSPARQTFLEGIFGGLLKIERTGMDGGKNFAGDWVQEGSGHYIGKGWIEVFNKTFTSALSFLPGQRGGDYRRQPAHLGLNAIVSGLDFSRGGQAHDAALLALAGRSLDFLTGDLQKQLATVANGGEPVDGGKLVQATAGGERPRINSGLYLSQLIEEIKKFITWYNNRTEHHMEGFDEVPFVDDKGRLRHHKESPNMRARRLLTEGPPVKRLLAADASLVMQHAKRVTVSARDGVNITIPGFGKVRFYDAYSIAIRRAAMNTNGKVEMTAVFDPDAFIHSTPDCVHDVRLHLLDEVTPEQYRAGMRGRYLESLKPAEWPDAASPEELAKARAEVKQVEHEAAKRLVRDLGIDTLAAINDARRNTQKFRAGQAVEVADGTAEPVESELLGDMHAGRNRHDDVEPQDEVSKSQRDLLNKLTQHKRAHADVDEEILETA